MACIVQRERDPDLDTSGRAARLNGSVARVAARRAGSARRLMASNVQGRGEFDPDLDTSGRAACQTAARSGHGALQEDRRGAGVAEGGPGRSPLDLGGSASGPEWCDG
jgi:hypothetical protein